MNLNLKVKRLIAYIIQVIFIILIYTIAFLSLNIIFFKTFKFFLSTLFTKFQGNLSSIILSSNIPDSTVISLIQKFNITDIKDINLSNINLASNQYEILKHILNSPMANKISLGIIIILVIYSFIFFTFLPHLTKSILYITGDIGKKITGLLVVRNGKRVSNITSINTSPAYNTFKLYYRLVLFFFISKPLYIMFLSLDFPKYFTIIIKLFYIISIIQVIISIIKITIYLVNFIMNNYKWRSDENLLIIDDFEEYANQSRKTEVRFPIFYKFMANNNYPISSYYRLEKKAKEIKKLSNLMNHIEYNQGANPNYINQNIEQFKEIINLVKKK